MALQVCAYRLDEDFILGHAPLASPAGVLHQHASVHQAVDLLLRTPRPESARRSSSCRVDDWDGGASSRAPVERSA